MIIKKKLILQEITSYHSKKGTKPKELAKEKASRIQSSQSQTTRQTKGQTIKRGLETVRSKNNIR